ncbi:ribonuclease H family protein [Schaalia cardiffensis]|uniref:ribonuclease H family protein n=1 Tax=Schaalia cardiffensis TaxID=181487 RepID=UPI0023F57969|nr:ribonuclease H [Schaalia cardiffensis]
MTITAAADGSSLGNPGPAGWAWVVDEDCWDAGGWPEGTNNLGELTAVLEVLKATEAAGLAGEDLHILCDSQYAINVVSKWRIGWKKRGWVKADKKPIKNLELIQQIDRAIEGRRVTFEWVKGHAGHALNELADEHARACAEEYRAGRVPSRGPGFSKSSTCDEDEAPDQVKALDAGDSEPALEGAQAVIALEKRMILAWTRGDAEALRGLEAGDATRIWPDGRTSQGMGGPAPVGLSVAPMNAIEAGGAWCVRYTIRFEGGSSAETSLWTPTDTGLKILLHQSTLVAGRSR